MKKNIAFILLATSLFMPVLANEANIKESTISADYSLNTEIAPDTAKIKMYVENSGTNLKELKEKNDKIVSEAQKKIKEKLGSDESIKTIAFSVNNVYSYKDKVRIFQKYEVKNGFEVKLKDLSKISEIIQIAMNSGIKNIGQLNFSIENGEATCNDLMAKATRSAKARAELIAASANAQLDKPKSINPYCSLNANYVQPRYYSNSLKAAGAMADTAMAENVVESIEPGSINVRAGVNMVYYLK